MKNYELCIPEVLLRPITGDIFRRENERVRCEQAELKHALNELGTCLSEYKSKVGKE